MLCLSVGRDFDVHSNPATDQLPKGGAFAGTVKQITTAALLLYMVIILFLSITCQSNALLQELVPR
jgi:hypothetical protein